MYFNQISVDGMGRFSYVIGCPRAKAMAVVDPKRDIQDYLTIAREEGMQVTHVFNTHVHADHVSGDQELRLATGADIYIHNSAPVKYTHKDLKEGDIFEIGAAKIEVLHTPGHTPNSISLLVTDKVRSEEPQMLLTGDLLFVGDIGRPDLPGADILDDKLPKVEKDEDLVLQCGSGYRSNIAASIMKQAGYANAKFLAGGIFAWSNAGFPVVSS